MIVASPAVDVFLKMIWPELPANRVCKTLLLSVIPVPLIINSPPPQGTLDETPTPKEVAPDVNTMLFTSTEVEICTSLCDD
jgi:hypothetical protein